MSDPDSNAVFNELEDEIVVKGRGIRAGSKANGREFSETHEDEALEGAPEESTGSHYPKRKRTSIFNDLSESKLESASAVAPEVSPTSPTAVSKYNRFRPHAAVKGVLLGTWRDSAVPNADKRHAVTGFIDVRDRLRTRVQPNTKEGESLVESYPLPPGPGGSWVTFERVVFSDHLVGLDHFQVKEYTRIRSDVPPEDTEEQRMAAELAAVREAIRRVKDNSATENPAQPPAIAYGPELPDHIQASGRSEGKRRKVSGGFAATNPAIVELTSESSSSMPQQAMASHQGRFPIDPLPGTRPTRILIGYWKPSSEADPKDRHAVYGILGQNDMFRVKVVRETRDGRFVDGNFPSGAGALWIPYEEVEFEPHLKTLNRSEVKEYCRVRQHQLDRGESSSERIENETKAVFEAQTRANGIPFKQPHNVTVPTFTASPQGDEDRMSGRHGYGGHELRQSRRTEPRPIRASLGENEMRAGRLHSVEAAERTNALARREIARAEAAQGRADRHAIQRERAAAAAAADAANVAAAAAAAASHMPIDHRHHNDGNGRMLFHESEDMQRLNKVWARQESLRIKGGSDEAKIYDGIKYERKATGPFMGKLVSQGTIINIEGEDYVEYRVLTKPSFF